MFLYGASGGGLFLPRYMKKARRRVAGRPETPPAVLPEGMLLIYSKRYNLKEISWMSSTCALSPRHASKASQILSEMTDCVSQ